MPQIEAALDRISELPGDEKRKILSCLWPEEAATTRLLSKSWNDMWLTLPSLELGFGSFSRKNKSTDNVIRAIDDILRRRSNCVDVKLLRDLTILIPPLPLDNGSSTTRHLVNEWIDLIVNRFRVQELDFMFSDGESLYEFPTNVLTSERQRMSSFKLCRCALKSSLTTTCSTLQTLALYNVSLDQQVLDSLTSNCPLIESLYIRDCSEDFDTIKASHLKRLVSFEIHVLKPLKRIEINAPNLLKFEYAVKYGMKDDVDVEGCVIENLSHSKGLTRLTLANGNRGLSHELLVRDLALYSKLEYLSVSNCCDGLKHLRVSNSSLRHLELIQCRDLGDVTIDDAPRLSTLIYWGKPIPFFDLDNAPSLVHVRLHLFDCPYTLDNDDDEEKHRRVVQFLTTFGHVRELHLKALSDSSPKIVPLPDYIRENLNPPLVGVKTLKAGFNDHVRNDDNGNPRPLAYYKSAVESLLWLSPRPDSLSISWSQFDSHASGEMNRLIMDTKIIGFKYDEDDDFVDKCDNCKHLPLRCWRHSQVTIQHQGSQRCALTDQHHIVLADFFKEHCFM